jgi:hypothetical protein
VIEEANNYDSNGSRTQSSGGMNFGLANSLNLGKKQSSTQQKQIVEVDDNEEYVDDDFEAVDSSNSENEFAKASVSQSGRLPPLSAANPIAAITNRSFSSNLDLSREGKLVSAYKN